MLINALTSSNLLRKKTLCRSVIGVSSVNPASRNQLRFIIDFLPTRSVYSIDAVRSKFSEFVKDVGSKYLASQTKNTNFNVTIFL